MRNRAVVLLVCCLLAGVLFGPNVTALAVDFPTKPITFIVPFSPGGGTDVAFRTVAHYAERYLNQPIVVENRPGAGGQIGFTAIAKAKPDGYTIGSLNVPAVILLPALRPDCTYTMSDFKTICNVILDPLVIAVRADSPFGTLASFMDYAQKNPGGITIGIDGPQSNNQLQGVIVEQKTGLQFNYVMFNGAAPALTATIGGHVDTTIPSAGEALPYVEGGQLRVLATLWPERFPLLPDVPTFEELTGVQVPPAGASARGIGAPRAVPADRLKILEEAFAKTVSDPEFLDKAGQIGLPILYMSGEEFESHIKSTKELLQQFIDLMKK